MWEARSSGREALSMLSHVQFGWTHHLAPVMLAGKQTHTVPTMPSIVATTIMNQSSIFSFHPISSRNIFK